MDTLFFCITLNQFQPISCYLRPLTLLNTRAVYPLLGDPIYFIGKDEKSYAIKIPRCVEYLVCEGPKGLSFELTRPFPDIPRLRGECF